MEDMPLHFKSSIEEGEIMKFKNSLDSILRYRLFASREAFEYIGKWNFLMKEYFKSSSVSASTFLKLGKDFHEQLQNDIIKYAKEYWELVGK